MLLIQVHVSPLCLPYQSCALHVARLHCFAVFGYSPNIYSPASFSELVHGCECKHGAHGMPRLTNKLAHCHFRCLHFALCFQPLACVAVLGAAQYCVYALCAC
jgi:hypothetical protein